MILEGRYVSQKSKRCTKGLNSTVLDVDNLPRKELNLVTDNPRKFGRAVVTPHAYHSKKVGRNKAAVEANKQQIHIILAEDEAQLRQNSVSAELVSDGSGAGRPPFIDVYSEGFDKLPLDVQVASYQRFRELSKLRISFLKKAQALAKK